MIKINYENIEEELNNPQGTPLKFDEFKDYYKKGNIPGQWIFKFENNYGASVIKHFGSYGYEEDLFELAVLYWINDKEWTLSYNTPLTDDVIGHLTNEEVIELLQQIKKLKGGVEDYE